MEISKLEDKSFIEEAMPNTLKILISYSIKDMASSELAELIDKLYAGLNIASRHLDSMVRSNFCDLYGLGEAIYDAFDLYDIRIQEVLFELLNERFYAEKEAARD